MHGTGARDTTDNELDVITVHGTFAADHKQRDDGDKWWQAGSPFWQRVQPYLDTRLNIRPFHWSGRNSEVDRRKAGAKLFKQLKQDQTEQRPPVIVGHSHGASSVVQTLLLDHFRGKRGVFDHIRGFVSIGMPLILFRSKRNPVTILDLNGRLALTAITGLLVVFLVSIIRAISIGSSITPVEIAVALATPIFGLAVIYFFLRRNFRRQRAFNENSVIGKAQSRYVRLAHSQDEAINALQQGLAIKPKIIRIRQIFIGVFSVLSLFFVANTYVEFVGMELVEQEMRSQMPGKMKSTEAFGTVATQVGSSASDDGRSQKRVKYLIFTQKRKSGF